jgi:uncharacterized protein YcbK (DUF882 family)
MKIPEYFKDSELACPCGCGKMPQRHVIKMLYILRLLFGGPIKVTSGARCKTYNKKIGGSKESLHIEGIAFDIRVKNHKNNEHKLIEYAMTADFRGIGIKDNTFLHIDYRIVPAVWGYKK